MHDSASDTSGGGTDGITVGSDGNIWVVETGLRKVAKIVPATGAITEYAVNAAFYGALQDIASLPNGTLWITGPDNHTQFQPGYLIALRIDGTTVPFNTQMPGYMQPGTFASDSEGRLFTDPSGDFWFSDGFDLVQMVP